MRGWLGWIAVTALSSLLVHFGVVVGVPRGIMLVVKHATAASPGRIIHSGPVTAASRQIVRPSPDLLYSLCRYDVSRRPLRVTAAVPDTYFSIAFYTANTDNFFVVNDQQIGAERVSLVLIREGMSHTPVSGERVVSSPTDEGVVLFRTLIKDRAQLERLKTLQRQADCWPVD
jgi:uncharacterized membrane protein